MIIIWGSRLYGKTDEVPGLLHVATKFGHLWYLPLIPMGSFVVFDAVKEGWQGVPIGLSFKSMLLGWLRVGTVVAGTILMLVALANQRQDPEAARLMYAGIPLLILFSVVQFLPGLRRASYERAKSLLDQIGASDQARTLVDLHYGMISESQAKARFMDAERAALAQAEAEIAERKAAFERAAFRQDPPDPRGR